MKKQINKKTAYIFPEVENIIITSELLFILDKNIRVEGLKKLTKTEVFDLWFDEANETQRFCICDTCGNAHSYTYENCEQPSELSKFFNKPVTVFLDTVK